MSLTEEFTHCLNTISHTRAGWDFQLPPAQRAEEARAALAAMDRARAIWSDNPDKWDALREAFAEARPLATMSEIERVPA